MPNFERKVGQLVDPNGNSMEIHHGFGNGAVLKVEGGNEVRHQIRMMFGNSKVDQGWWVDQKTIAQLVAQLLYLRQDLIDHGNFLGQKVEADIFGDVPDVGEPDL